MNTKKAFDNFRGMNDSFIEEDEVYIKHVANTIVLIPKSNPWYNLYRGIDMFSDDFMLTREQPELETWEPIDIPRFSGRKT